MVGGGDPGRLRDGRGVGDVFTQWKMYAREATYNNNNNNNNNNNKQSLSGLLFLIRFR